MRTLARELFEAALWLQQVNDTFLDKAEFRLAKLEVLLPSGSGFNDGTKVDVAACRRKPQRLVLYTSFDHMNEVGYYTGETHHTLIVTPTFYGLDIRITGRNKAGIKDYIYEVFEYDLTRAVETVETDKAGGYFYRLKDSND